MGPSSAMVVIMVVVGSSTRVSHGSGLVLRWFGEWWVCGENRERSEKREVGCGDEREESGRGGGDEPATLFFIFF